MRNQDSRKIRKKGLCLPGGYRYCGPRCSGPGAPINYVDSCCKRHDNCVSISGDCLKCDQMLIQCVQAKANLRTNQGRTARLISNFMKFRIGFSKRR